MSQPTPTSVTLKRISERSHEALKHISGVLPSYATHHVLKPDMPTHPPLPYPRLIISDLLQIGVSFGFAELASRAYLQSTLTLRRDYERHISHVSRVWVETSVHLEGRDACSHLTSIYAFFASHYKQSLNHIVDRILALVHSKLLAPQPSKEKRNAFNKGVTPVLEDFYSKNPFPSSSDRQELAYRTKLTLEQIRIWFQNRRARARRSGQTPRRKVESLNMISCQPSNVPVDLESEISRLIDDEIRRSSGPKVEAIADNTAPAVQQTSVLWPLGAPEHAFPSPYRPTPRDDPFPVKDDLINFDIPWIRQTSPHRRVVTHPFPDVSDLANVLSILSLDDGHGDTNKHSTYPITNPSSIHSMWILASPSALRPVVTGEMRRWSFKQKSFCRHGLRKGSLPQSLSSHDTSPRAKPYHRYKPQPSLPRRIPQTQPQLISYRRSSHSQFSRSPSISSIASDDSFSSYASSSDSELGTPPPVSTDLPIYVSEKGSPPSYISPINLPKLSKALLQSPVAPRTYTFRTTIVPS